MAFVYKAPRFQQKDEETANQDPGPGNYNVQKKRDTKHGYAPFGSTVRRQKEKKNNHQGIVDNLKMK